MGYVPAPPPNQDWIRPEMTWRDWLILGAAFLLIVVLPSVGFAAFLMAMAF